MSYLKSRGTMMVFAQALLLCACGQSGDPQSQQAGRAAQDDAPTQDAVPAPTPAAPALPDAGRPGTAALREFRDPVTGQPRAPTAAELKALETPRQTAPSAGATTRPSEREILFPNGTVAVEEGPLTEMKGCVQQDGSVAVGHDCRSGTLAPSTKP